MENNELGKKIAELRTNKNLNIKQLAEKVNVTSSLLSQIEHGLASPSLNTLRMIAAALEVPMFSFFMENINHKDLIVRADYRKKLTFPTAKNLEYLLLSPDLTGTIEMVLMKIPSQSQSCQEPLAHVGEEVAYVLSGSVVLHLEDVVETLHTGDSVKIPPGTKHKWENQTDEVVTVIFAITPPTF